MREKQYHRFIVIEPKVINASGPISQAENPKNAANARVLRVHHPFGCATISQHELQTLPVFEGWGMLFFGNTCLGSRSLQKHNSRSDFGGIR
jgi:hypothetical protein